MALNDLLRLRSGSQDILPWGKMGGESSQQQLSGCFKVRPRLWNLFHLQNAHGRSWVIVGRTEQKPMFDVTDMPLEPFEASKV